MSGPGGGTWPGGEPATFEEALEAGGEVRRELVLAGARLPKKDLSRLLPASMADAVSIVHARLEDNKKKAAASKAKSKSKSGAPQSPSDTHLPGARQGGGDPSAFWMYVEDYFRDFSQDDLRGLLPLLLDPRDDPALQVPPCGRRLEDEQQQRKHVAAKAAAEAARAAAAAASRDWDAAVDSKPSLDGSPDAERRSSRLVSRHSKEEEQRRQSELEAHAAAAASAAEQAEAAAAAAAARAMVVPTTANGAPAKQLLDVLPEQRLALLLQQLTDLQRLVGLEPFGAAPTDAAVQAALAKLQTATSSNGSSVAAAGLDVATRILLQDWLRQQLAQLARQLGSSAPVLPPWAGQQPAAAGKDPSAAAATCGVSRAGSTQGAVAAAAEAAAANLPNAAYLHPYTELMLRHPVQHHTVQQAVETPAQDALVGPSRQATLCREEGGTAGGEVPLGAAAAAAGEGAGAGLGEAATPSVSLMAATPRSARPLAEAPSVADFSSLSEQQQEDPGAAAAGEDPAAAAGAGAGDTAGTADAAGQGSPAAARDSLAAAAAAAAAADDGTPLHLAALGPDGLLLQQQLGSGGGAPRAGGRARGISNYALLAGKKSASRAATGPPKKVVRTATVKQEAADAASAHPVARAVAALVAAGEPEGSGAEQWAASVESCPRLLAAAPEDEVLAEMLALQNELMQQAAINRARLAPALAGVLAELDARRAAAELRAQEEELVKAWILKMREIKRQQHRHRREAAHQEALAAKKQSIMASPRPVLGRQRGSYGTELEGGAATPREGSPPLEYALRPHELYDVLAQREAEQESFCAVCGGGNSEAPNQIVFCERCDVAVHQQCYGIAQVPDDEWLCEPCCEYEGQQRAQGVPLAAIRPPAWQADHKPLPGGARTVNCALCPIRFGAFKKAEDGQRWVHSACALWVPETSISHRDLPGVGRQEYVAGLDKLKADRLDGRCGICGLSEGAVMACQQPGGCNNAFHVLCARNIGLYLTIRPDPARKAAVQYRMYCALHSAAQQSRDEKAWQERMEKAQHLEQKEGKVKQAERFAAAKQGLAQQEHERFLLYTLRANLETCRMLIDVTKRRERLKKQLAVQQQQQWPLLQQHPEAAVRVVQKRQKQQAQEQAAAAAAAAAAAQQQQQQQVVAVEPLQTQQQQPPQQQQSPSPQPQPLLQQQQQQQQFQPQLQLPPFSIPPLPLQQQQPLQQQPQQQIPLMSSMVPIASLHMPLSGPASSSMHFMPQPPPVQLQQQQPMMAPLSQALAPPSFALDMFAQHPQQQQVSPHHFFMQTQQQIQQQQQQQIQQQQQQQQMGSLSMLSMFMSGGSAAAAAAPPPAAAATAAFAGLPFQLPPSSSVPALAGLAGMPHPPQQQQLVQQQQPGQQLPATAAGMLVSVAGGAAAAAQVPADVAAAMFGVPSSSSMLMPQLHMPTQQQQRLMMAMPPAAHHQQQQQLPKGDPGLAAAVQGQPPSLRGSAAAGAAAAFGAGAGGASEPSPSPRHPGPAAAAAGGGTPRGMSPQAPADVAGRPKRAAPSAAQAGGSKRRRAGSEDTPTAAAAAAAAGGGGFTPAAADLPPPGPGSGAAGSAGAAAGADAAAGGGSGGAAGGGSGRRQRTATAKVRENLLQRERQMTAEEAEHWNARLPGPLRYYPAAELEATLGMPTGARGGASGSGSSAGQRQSKLRNKPGGR